MGRSSSSRRVDVTITKRVDKRRRRDDCWSSDGRRCVFSSCSDLVRPEKMRCCRTFKVNQCSVLIGGVCHSSGAIRLGTLSDNLRKTKIASPETQMASQKF